MVKWQVTESRTRSFEKNRLFSLQNHSELFVHESIKSIQPLTDLVIAHWRGKWSESKKYIHLNVKILQILPMFYGDWSFISILIELKNKRLVNIIRLWLI